MCALRTRSPATDHRRIARRAATPCARRRHTSRRDELPVRDAWHWRCTCLSFVSAGAAGIVAHHPAATRRSTHAQEEGSPEADENCHAANEAASAGGHLDVDPGLVDRSAGRLAAAPTRRAGAAGRRRCHTHRRADRAPVAQVHDLGTAGFRYWTAAEALRRAAAFWNGAGAARWHGDVGATLAGASGRRRRPERVLRADRVPAGGCEAGALVLPRHRARRRHGAIRHRLLGRKSRRGGARAGPRRPRHAEARPLGRGGDRAGRVPRVVRRHERRCSPRSAARRAPGGDRGDRGQLAAQLVGVPRGRAARLRDPAAESGRRRRGQPAQRRQRVRLRRSADAAVDNGPASGLTRAPHNFSRVFTGAFLEALGGMVRLAAGSPRRGPTTCAGAAATWGVCSSGR